MYVAGHHTAHFSATSDSSSAGADYYNLGSTRDGYRMVNSHHSQNVTDDAYGDAIPDGIQQGTDTMIRFTSIEYDLSKLAYFQPTPQGKINDNVGKLLTKLAGTLVLTPIAGTTAETDLGVGKSRIYYLAIIDSDVETLMSSKLREGPMSFRCFPDKENSGVVWDIIDTPSFPNDA